MNLQLLECGLITLRFVEQNWMTRTKNRIEESREEVHPLMVGTIKNEGKLLPYIQKHVRL